MSAFSHKLVIPIIGDTRSFDKAIRKAINGSEHLNSRMGRLAKGFAVAGVAAVGAGATMAIAFGIKAVKAAASLEQSMYRVNRVFGKSSGIIKRWSETTAGALGINRDQSLEFAGSLGLVMTNLGMGQRKAALMARQLVTRASDVAILNKADPADVISGFQRGLTGMTRGLKKYGIVVDQTAIKNEAIRSGIAEMTVSDGDVQKATVAVTKAIKDQADAIRKHGANSEIAKSATANLTYQQEKLTKAIGGKMPQLSAQQKMLATLNLMFQKSTTAAGASRHRIGTWGQVWKRIHASVHDLTEEFGTGLLPVVTKVARTLATKLADPRFRSFVRKLGHDIGVTLLNAFTSLVSWFKANWPAIMAGFRTANRILQRIIGTVKALMDQLGPLVSLLGKAGFLTHGKIGAVLGKAAELGNPITRTAAIAGAVGRGGAHLNVNGDIHVHGVDDPKKLVEKIHREAKKRPQQTRGHGHPHHP